MDDEASTSSSELAPDKSNSDKSDVSDAQPTSGVFSSDYTPTKTGGHHALTALPEESSVEVFENPSILVTGEDAEVPTVSTLNSSTPSPVFELSPNVGLSPVFSGSPNQQQHLHHHHRRRSSASGHRRRSSTKSLTGLGISSPDTRRHSSIVSNGSTGEFEDFQEGDDASDFGDFDDFEEGEFSEHEGFEAQEEEPAHAPQRMSFMPLPDLQSEEDVQIYLEAAMNELMPELTSQSTDLLVKIPAEVVEESLVESEEEDDSPFMLTDRAISLWRQLTAPPPLQPPDWKQSRIRRLFLVSLGIPVDLDEILPKMTHKKLILPSTKRHKDKNATEERRSRRKIPPPPEFEIGTARLMSKTTKEALSAMTAREKQIHVATLEAHTVAASTLLTYWLEQREVAQSEKETFEQVVSNLVQYHKKQKDEQRESAIKVSKKTRSRFSMRG